MKLNNCQKRDQYSDDNNQNKAYLGWTVDGPTTSGALAIRRGSTPTDVLIAAFQLEDFILQRLVFGGIPLNFRKTTRHFVKILVVILIVLYSFFQFHT